MASRRSSCAAALLLSQPLAACSDEPPPAANAVAEAARPPAKAATREQSRLVLAFGDSLYAGYGVLPQQSFPAGLERALREQGIAATVHNAGVSGDTTAAGRARIGYVLDGLDRPPDLALVGLGGNDMLRGIDPAETRANLDAILAELKRRGIPVVLTGMLAAPFLDRAYRERFEAIYPDLARKYDAALYPFILDGVVTVPSLMLPDRVHPNPRGIERMVERVAPLVAEQLRT